MATSSPAAGGFEPALWRCLDVRHPEAGLAHQRVKRLFWRGPDGTLAATERRWLDVDPDKLSAPIFAKAAAQTVTRSIRPGDPEKDARNEVVSQMEHKTPQFNLRNVARAERDVDLETIEWSAVELPDRRGYTQDLAEIRAARIDPPEFHADEFTSVALRDLQDVQRVVFLENDWEQWYGEDKKRTHGALWRYTPENGGRRTRPWPEVRLVPYLYWKGRLMEA